MKKGGKKIITLLIIAVILVVGFFAWRMLTGIRESADIEDISIRQENVDVSTPIPTEQEVEMWTVAPDLPRFMSIAAIDMKRARVESLGIKAGTDQMDDPANPWNVGWYNKSAKPGVAGAGIYDCHTFFGTGHGLCNSLWVARVGSEIVVERGDGLVFTYGVTEVKTMSLDEANQYMPTLFEVPNGATQAISIITCSGTFNNNTQTSDQRTIVRAILK